MSDEKDKNTATFRYFGNLPKLLKRDYQQELIAYRFKEHPGVKDAIEAMGIPHTEVDLIIANNLSVDFDYQLQHDDTIAVYSLHCPPPQVKLHHLTPQAPEPTTFTLDVHLGKLAGDCVCSVSIANIKTIWMTLRSCRFHWLRTASS